MRHVYSYIHTSNLHLMHFNYASKGIESRMVKFHRTEIVLFQ